MREMWVFSHARTAFDYMVVRTLAASFRGEAEIDIARQPAEIARLSTVLFEEVSDRHDAEIVILHLILLVR